MKKIVSTFLIAGIGGITSLGLYHLFQSPVKDNFSQITNQAPVKYVNMPSLAPETSIDFTVAAEMSVHSVVNVRTTYSYRDYQNQYSYNPFHGFF